MRNKDLVKEETGHFVSFIEVILPALKPLLLSWPLSGSPIYFVFFFLLKSGIGGYVRAVVSSKA